MRDIAGIGPATLKVLNDAKIVTFAQLAKTPVDELRELFKKARQPDTSDERMNDILTQARDLAGEEAMASVTKTEPPKAAGPDLSSLLRGSPDATNCRRWSKRNSERSPIS